MEKNIFELFEENIELENEIYALNREYGHKHIYGLLIEEMAELSAELMKIVNGKDFDKESILEEFADVEITLNQAKKIAVREYEKYESLKNNKLCRTAERLGL